MQSSPEPQVKRRESWIKQRWRIVRPSVLGGLITVFARLLGKTLRVSIQGWDQATAGESGRIFGLWHGQTFGAGQAFRNKGIWVMISHSKDGDIQNRILGRMGFKVIRGSTGRGGERALVESIRTLKSGEMMAITPDGPRGPNRQVQMGLIVMAIKAQVPIVPVGAAASPAIRFKSWDNHQIPKPFARTAIHFGEPLMPPAKDSSETEQMEFRNLVQSKIEAQQALAEHSVEPKKSTREVLDAH